MTQGDPYLQDGCDRTCLAASLCRAAVTVNTQTGRCEELRAKLYAAVSHIISTLLKIELIYDSSRSWTMRKTQHLEMAKVLELLQEIMEMTTAEDPPP